jgi:hypothetical protein
MVLTPEQLSALAEAGFPDGSKVTLADQDDVTFELQKGRLDRDDEGSTVIVRGGHDYDSETGTVTVTSPLEEGPDGLLVDENGKVHHLTAAAVAALHDAAAQAISAAALPPCGPQHMHETCRCCVTIVGRIVCMW